MRVIDDIVEGSEEWLAWRRQGIGGSDIAAICGVSPYDDALGIYEDKKGLRTKYKSAAMQRGIDGEPWVRDLVNRGKVQPFVKARFVHDKFPQFRASLDGYCEFSRTILEIKIPNRKTLDMARYDQIPLYYLYQIQWQLYVSGMPKATYACANPETEEIYQMHIYPDFDIQKKMIAAANDFWDAVVNDRPPPSGKRESVYVFDLEAQGILERMMEAKRKAKEHEAIVKGYNDEFDKDLKTLLERLGDENSLEIDDIKLNRVERSTIDYKQAALDARVDLEKYKKPKTVYWTIKETEL